MRAVEARARTGFVDRDGVKMATRSTERASRPSCSRRPVPIVHSQMWKAQVPYLARHLRVITIDPRGNGRSDRPDDPAGYDELAYAEDLVAVLDAVGQERAVAVGALQRRLVGHRSRRRGTRTASAGWSRSPRWPASSARRTRSAPCTRSTPSWTPTEGWAKYNAAYWRRDYDGFLEFFFGQLLREPHSTKPQRGLRRLGAGDHGGGADQGPRQRPPVPGPAARRRGAAARRSPARCWSSTAPRTVASRGAGSAGTPS